MEAPITVGCLVSISTEVTKSPTQNCETEFFFFGVKLELSIARASNLVTITLRGVDPIKATANMVLLVDRRERHVLADGRVASTVNRQLKPQARMDFDRRRKVVWSLLTLEDNVCRMTIDIEFSRIVSKTIPVTFDVSSKSSVLVNPGLFQNSRRIEGSRHVMEIMQKLHLSDEGKDCTIVLLGMNRIRIEGPPIKAHSIILGASSEQFAMSFQVVEVNGESKEFTLVLVDAEHVTFSGVKALVKFLYGVLGDEEFFKHRDELQYLSQKYEIFHLREACYKALAIDLNSKNVVKRLKQADQYDHDYLVELCLQFMSRRIYEIKDMDKLVNAMTVRLGKRLRHLFHGVKEIASLFGWTEDAAV